MSKPIIPVISGPTASGKTALGIALAQAIGGEIVSADSMQIYDCLPVCSAQPTKEELAAVPHHLIGFLPFTERFTVVDWREKAIKTIEELLSRGKRPVIVGGTSLYVHALLYEPDFGADSDPAVREALERSTNEELYARLIALDPNTFVSVADRKRLVRFLEVYTLTGRLPGAQETWKKKNETYDFRLFCVSPPREELYARIESRVDQMLENGMIPEVRALWEQGIRETDQCYKAIGCRQLIDVWENRATMEEAVAKIKQESRRYAKRQLTWMRAENAYWVTAPDTAARVSEILPILEN